VHLFITSVNSVNVDAFIGTPVLRSKQSKIISSNSRISTPGNPKTRLLSFYQSFASPPLSSSEPESKPSKTKRLSLVLEESNKELKKHSNNDTITSTRINDNVERGYTTKKQKNIDRNKSIEKKKPYKNPKDVGPYADFTEKELFELTENLLSCPQLPSTPETHSPVQIIPIDSSEPSKSYQEDTNAMTRQQLHEISRLMSSWTKRGVEQSGIITERLLNKVIDEKIKGNKKATLNPIMFHMAITAWLNCGPKKNAYEAASIFEKMISLYEQDQRNTQDKAHFPMPNIAICNVVLESLAKCTTKKAALCCESILNKMEVLSLMNEDIHNSTDAITSPTNATDTLIPKLKKEENVSMERAALTTTKPNIRTYNAVMNAWAQARVKISGERAEQIFSKVRALSQSSNDPYIQLNQKSFNIAIHAWSKCKERGSAKKAENILEIMEQDYESGRNKNAKPDNISYTSVLTAWANSNEKVSARRAEELLERMEQLYCEQDEEELGSFSNRKEWPDTISYNAVLNVYAKSEERDAGERCERLFQKMEYLYRMGNENVKPDLVSYNSLINVIATNPGTLAAAHRAREILEQMEHLYISGDESVKPDVVTYNSVIKAYSNSRETTASKTAESILKRMELMHEEDEKNVEPDAYTYNTVIHCWANSGDISAAQRAELLLHQMAKKYSRGNRTLKPTVVSYNSVLNALSKTKDADAPNRSGRILTQMIHLYNAGDISVKPDVFSFCTVINTWSKSKALDKADRAVGLLRKMEDMDVKPNTFVYTAVLNACAYTFGDEKRKINAMNMAVDILEELQNCKHCNANHVTYATFFKACCNLLSNIDSQAADGLIEEVWHQATIEGQVGPATVAQLERAASPALHDSLVGHYINDGEDMVFINDLPKQWTCNVREKRHRKYTRSKKR